MSAGVLDSLHTSGPSDRRGGLSAIRFWLVVGASLAIASAANHAIAAVIGLAPPAATYRRIGPETGPQVFVAGSSLLQFGLSWPEISATLGRGMENWGVGGSSPEMWEVPQDTVSSDLMIVGVSVYDLNEYHLSKSRAHIVPLRQTVRDLRESTADWQLARRVLSQYPFAYMQVLFPAAGDSDGVLVGVRRLIRQGFGLSSASQDRAAATVLPSRPILDFGESTAKLSDLDPGRTLRRLALVRSENRGMHSFAGPKQLAFRRMLRRAHQSGRVIVVVLPVAAAYEREFLTQEVIAAFERQLADALKSAPNADVVRLDRVPHLGSDDHFSDFVHLNSAGREIATAAFLHHLQSRR